MKLINIQENATHVICTFSGKTKFIPKTFKSAKRIDIFYENACVYKTENSNMTIFYYKSDFPKSIPYFEDVND